MVIWAPKERDMTSKIGPSALLPPTPHCPLHGLIHPFTSNFFAFIRASPVAGGILLITLAITVIASKEAGQAASRVQRAAQTVLMLFSKTKGSSPPGSPGYTEPASGTLPPAPRQ